jgi:hypothetical protein
MFRKAMTALAEPVTGGYSDGVDPGIDFLFQS